MDNAAEREKELLNRLKLIEGQIRGLQKMITEGRDCEEIVVQLSATRAALDKVAVTIVSSRMVECIAQELGEKGDCQAAMDRALAMFLKLS